MRIAVMDEEGPPGVADRVLGAVVVMAAIAFVAVYAATAVLRMAYPYELEWMEGGVAEHVSRLLHGQAIYVRPTLSFVPFPYTPLYYAVAAGATKVFGSGFLPLRLVSFLSSLATFGILYRLVAKETGDRTAAILAVGACAATFRLSGAWMDLARPDSLFLALFWAGVYALRSSRVGPSAIALWLSFLTKQIALPMCVPVLAWAIWRDRRSGLATALATGGLVLLTILAGSVLTHGWFFYYAFSLPFREPSGMKAFVDFFRRDLLGPLGIAVAFALAALVLQQRDETRRRTRFYAALFAGATGGSFLMRIHPGGYSNTLLPAYSALAALFGVGLSTCRSIAPVRWARPLLLFVALLQLASLAADPRALIPGTADRNAGDQIVRALREVPGDVLVWSHPYLLGRAGKTVHAHEEAVDYVITGDRAGEGARLLDEFAGAIASHRFAALVVDETTVMPSAAWKTAYVPARSLIADPDALWTKTGRRTRPETLWFPRP